jgi:uncharacterized peroxidase-related enzyme
MSRITPADYGTATGEQKALLDAVKSFLGATPNMTTTMARSAVLEAWLNLNGALRNGSIGIADAERIALGVAEANGCSYCLSAHTYVGANVARLNDVELRRARDFESADPKSATVLAFARAVLSTRGGVSESDIAVARQAGLTDVELSDIVGHVALNVLTNYFNKAFDVEVDFPVVEPHAHAAAA